ncbi:MAG TPA: Hsp20/alpha crystallin family protein [Pirellulales bacterium]|nr:Hsp20/alpha crystallin family protein [Pirellulales bacterium]
MENLMERFFNPEDGRWLIGFVPAVNVAETENAFEVTLELPGMKAEDFKVEMKKGELWISGEKREEKEEKGKTFHRIERSSGEFRRVIPLPGEVAEEKIEAEYKEGVLKVVVPKTEKAKPRRVEVKS